MPADLTRGQIQMLLAQLPPIRAVHMPELLTPFFR